MRAVKAIVGMLHTALSALIGSTAALTGVEIYRHQTNDALTTMLILVGAVWLTGMIRDQFIRWDSGK